MRFLIYIEPDSATNGWQVSVRQADQTGWLHQRIVQRLGPDAECYPQPPASETQSISATEPHHALCMTTDVQTILDCYERIIQNAPRLGEATAFGRYLFATLLGPEAWQKIKAAAPNQAMDLELL